jgi:hypothetical protein
MDSLFLPSIGMTVRTLSDNHHGFSTDGHEHHALNRTQSMVDMTNEKRRRRKQQKRRDVVRARSEKEKLPTLKSAASVGRPLAALLPALTR